MRSRPEIIICCRLAFFSLSWLFSEERYFRLGSLTSFAKGQKVSQLRSLDIIQKPWLLLLKVPFEDAFCSQRPSGLHLQIVHVVWSRNVRVDHLVQEANVFFRKVLAVWANFGNQCFNLVPSKSVVEHIQLDVMKFGIYDIVEHLWFFFSRMLRVMKPLLFDVSLNLLWSCLFPKSLIGPQRMIWKKGVQEDFLSRSYLIVERWGQVHELHN